MAHRQFANPYRHPLSLCSVCFVFILLLVLLSGCGSSQNAAIPPSDGQSGQYSLTIYWPTRRFIPLACNSIEVALHNNAHFSTSRIIDRPAGGGSSLVLFSAVPVGEVQVTASAYPQAEAAGVVQATGTVMATILANKTAQAIINMNSTITHLVLNTITVTLSAGGTLQLVATPENSLGQVVLIAADGLAWSAAPPAVASVNASGLLTAGATTGLATITVIERESGVAATVRVTVMPYLPRITAPPRGAYYHGVFPGDADGTGADITLPGVQSYESTVGAKAAWILFCNNWFTSRQFPLATATWIRAHGAVPYIQLLMRSSLPALTPTSPPPTAFTLQQITAGDYDADLRAWAHAAHAFGTPLIVEYGNECNGSWFQWNGYWNGGAAIGPERFIAAYRHIVLLMRAAGATNITWVFHVSWVDAPAVAWNKLEYYYPGDDVIDWVGASCYGAQTPLDTGVQSFRSEMDSVYPRLTALAPTKPVFVLEFGCTSGNPEVQQDVWTSDALTDILAARWPAIAGFSWWNEEWCNDNIPADCSDMRVQDNPALARVFQQSLANPVVLQQPIITSQNFTAE